MEYLQMHQVMCWTKGVFNNAVYLANACQHSLKTQIREFNAQYSCVKNLNWTQTGPLRSHQRSHYSPHVTQFVPQEVIN